MTPGPFERARAERFAQLLDEATDTARGGARPDGAHDDELAPLAETAATMAARLAQTRDELAPDAGYKSRLRGRLMAVAAVQGIGTEAESPAPEPEPAGSGRFGLRRLIVAVTVVAGVLALSGMSAASGEAMPGDALYDVKRSTERAQLALAGSDVNRGQLYLEFARNRLTEAAAVAGDPAAVAETLRDMDDETRQGVALLTGAAVDRTDEGVLDAVETFVDVQRGELVDLVAASTGDSRSRGLDSLALLDDVEERAEDLRFSLLCTASGQTRVDRLGPLPLSCSAAPANPPAHDPEATATDPQASRDSRPGGEPGETSPSGDSPDDAKSPEPGEDGLDGVTPTIGPNPSPSATGSPGDEPDDESGLLGTLGGILSGLLGG